MKSERVRKEERKRMRESKKSIVLLKFSLYMYCVLHSRLFIVSRKNERGSTRDRPHTLVFLVVTESNPLAPLLERGASRVERKRDKEREHITRKG